MKKKLLVCLFACAMALSFAVPAMAAGVDVTVAEPVSVEASFVEIQPFNEVTQIVFRTYGGVLQWRVWSVTWGRWITDWMVV